MMDFEDYIEFFKHLHTATVKGFKAPHKAVLLLSIMDLVESNTIRYPQIELTDELVSQFKTVWRRYLVEPSFFSPDIAKPYFHMQHEPFWKLVEKYDTEAMLAAEDSPWQKEKSDKKLLPTGRYSVKALRNAFEYAEIDEGLFEILQDVEGRDMLRAILISEYLSDQPARTVPNLAQLILALPILAFVA